MAPMPLSPPCTKRRVDPEREPWALAAYADLQRVAWPLLRLYLWQRALRGIDRWDKARERLGRPGVDAAPEGPVLWFHGASIGECAMAVALVRKCLAHAPHASVVFTTQDTAALAFLEDAFARTPVVCQYAPLDSAGAIQQFLHFWRPQCAVLMESELWPNLLLAAHSRSVRVGILNARMARRSFQRWSTPAGAALAEAMLARVALVATPSPEQALQFQLLGANPSAVHFSGDLKFTTHGTLDAAATQQVHGLQALIGQRPAWIAASTHPGEDEAVAKVHLALMHQIPSLLTIIAPRHPARRHAIHKSLTALGLTVALRSRGDPVTKQTQVYLSDTSGELNVLYSAIPLAFVGGSLFPGMGGHNLAEAAYGACAVLVGPHPGHFQCMVDDMQSSAPLSVWQVADERELRRAVKELLSNEAKLNARCMAAKRAAHAAADGVALGVWELVHTHLLRGLAAAPAARQEGGPDAELSPILHRHLARAESNVRVVEPRLTSPNARSSDSVSWRSSSLGGANLRSSSGRMRNPVEQHISGRRTPGHGEAESSRQQAQASPRTPERASNHTGSRAQAGQGGSQNGSDVNGAVQAQSEQGLASGIPVLTPATPTGRKSTDGATPSPVQTKTQRKLQRVRTFKF